jgi:pimeloyl-ACP methyl ester carboxylesterase
MSLQTPAPEKYLELSDGRTLAYAESGNSSSSTLVIYMHGMFTVGRASDSKVLVEKDIHYIAPTLPGWGTSSPRNKDKSFALGLVSDITALIDHIHPHDLNLKIYVAGGSFGTVPAQMLYGAPFEVFPYGRYVAGCMLLAPLSPPRYDTEYTKSLTMANYISIGPPSRYIPFKLVPRLVAFIIHRQVKTVEDAERFIRGLLFDKMKEEESAAFKKWKEENDKKDGELERKMAEDVRTSVQYSWEGCLDAPDVIHEDWGFNPTQLDDEHNKRPIFIVAADGDTMAPGTNARWLAASYKNSRYQSLSGGHISALFHMNDLWRQFLEI